MAETVRQRGEPGMIPIGAIINALGITIGGLVGLAFGARLPERVRAVMNR